MRKPPSITRKPALDVIDDAVALLRECPLSIRLLYYIGAVPFVLDFLYFWADMSRGAFAREHLVESSLFVALAFIWCKFWQSLFSTHLLAVAARRCLPPWTWRKLLRVAAVQATIQSTGLFLLPIAFLITLPAGFAFAFYQNTSILALDSFGEPQDTAALRKEAIAHAGRWPWQNHIGLAVLLFFALVVFLNIGIMFFVLPSMLKTLLGIETMFSRSLFSMFNSTFFAATAAIAWLCVDPLVKAFYTVRCFHGRALSTGEDLQIRIRTLAPARLHAVAAVLLLSCAGIAHGAAPAAAPPAHAAELNQSITNVLNKPEFAWRAPRETVSDDEKSATDNFIDGIIHMISRWLKPIKTWAREFGHWLRDWSLRQKEDDTSSGGGNWLGSLKFFAWIFCGIAVCALGIIGWKLWLRRAAIPEILAEPLPVIPDLNSEDIAADQLPEDAWMGLARLMIEKGDFRLALRAFFLAALAHLGQRNIISIARYKSNYDYQRELRRRRPGQAELITTFSETVGAFEHAWYGMHEVTMDGLNASQVNLERIRES